MPENTQGGNILFKDLTAQQVVDLAKRVELSIKRENRLDRFCEIKHWDKKVSAVQTRVFIPADQVKRSEIANYVLREEVAPRYGEVKYATKSHSVNSYGYKFKYTWKAVEQSADDIVGDCAYELSQWVVDMKTAIIGNAMLASANSLTWSQGDTLLKLIKRAKNIFKKMKCKPFEGGNFYLVADPDVHTAIADEYFASSSGHSLPTETVSDAMAGTLTRFSEVLFFDPENDDLTISRYATTASGHTAGDPQYYNVAFVAKSPNGAKPIRVFDGGAPEIIHNPLGSGVIEDIDGNISADDNKQVGSIACNLKRFGATVMDDRAILTVQVPATYIATTTGMTPEEYKTLTAHDLASMIAQRQTEPAKVGGEYDSDGALAGYTTVTPIAVANSTSPVAPASEEEGDDDDADGE